MGFRVVGLAVVVGLRVVGIVVGLRLGDFVGIEDGGVVVRVGEKVGQYVGMKVGSSVGLRLRLLRRDVGL